VNELTKEINFKEIGEALKSVFDPEIHISIVDLGLVYGAEIARDKEPSIKIYMTLTSPACPYGPMILADAHSALAKVVGMAKVDIDLVFDPPWDPRVMASEEAKEQMGLF
jgi:metal-sulfur cluster biosynthetic enzyme